ncbi:MAG: hypothetical protein HYW51_02900 [Candidatus Doudnabacteria bacterium]|nr:hypothetical protein [Candidatus Doudnabacteria bacterium]
MNYQIKTKVLPLSLIVAILPLMGVGLLFYDLFANQEGDDYKILALLLFWLIAMFWFIRKLHINYILCNDSLVINRLLVKSNVILLKNLDELEIEKISEVYGMQMQTMRNGGNIIIKTGQGKYTMLFVSDIDNVAAEIVARAQKLGRQVKTNL